MIYLVEYFFSIQGEGRYLGTPSIFLRFGGCNMRCSGFDCHVETPQGGEVVGCDTAYAVFKSEFQSTWQEINQPHELIDIVRSYKVDYKADVVLTGGEPLIYANDPILAEFVTYLISNGHRVTFETNGAIDLDFERFAIYRECVYALSVKLASSGEPASRRINIKALDNIVQNAKESFYKFTVSAKNVESEEKEIEAIIADRAAIAIYCMPLGGSKAGIEDGCEAVIELCKRKGYLYSDRLHIRIWDQIQGV